MLDDIIRFVSKTKSSQTTRHEHFILIMVIGLDWLNSVERFIQPNLT